MAQIALVVAAQAAAHAYGWGSVATAIATAAAATAGAIIDQAYVYPAIFGRQNSQGPRIDDFQVQTASEGSPINYLIGKGRLAGTLIWCGPVREVKNTEDVGGKGSGGTNSTFTYFNSIAIGLCEGPIEGIEKIWADSRLIYRDGGFHNLLSWSMAFSNTDWVKNGISILENQDSGPFGDGGDAALDRADQLTFYAIPSDTLPKYADHRLQRQWVDVEPSAEYTLSWYVKRGTYAGQLKYSLYDRTNDTDFVSPADYPTTVAGDWVRQVVTFTTPSGCKRIDITLIGPTAAPTDAGTLFLYGAQLELGAVASDVEETDGSPVARDGSLYDSVVVHTGAFDQAPDPIIEAGQGVDQVPGFRGIGYVVIENFALTPFGNRIPQFSFLTKETSAMTLDVALTKVLARANLAASEFDVTDVDPLTVVIGQMTAGPTSPLRQMEPLMMAGNLMVVESNATIKVIQRNKSVARLIPSRHLAAHSIQGSGERDPTPRKATFTDVTSDQIPAEINITYQDPATDYQQGAQQERRSIWRSDNVQKFDLPLVMSSFDARNMTYQLLYNAGVERRGVEIFLPPSYIDMEETDLLGLQISPNLFNMRVVRLTRGADFVVEAKGVIEFIQTFETPAALPPPPCIPGFSAAMVERIYSPDVSMALAVLDVPALQDTDQSTPSVYVATSRIGAKTEWRGAIVYASTDAALVGTKLAEIKDEGVLGLANTVLAADGDPDPSMWDVTNTLTVTLYHGTLESRSDTDVLNGNNWIQVGAEILGYQTATLIAKNQYTLSNLRRGLRNTEDAISTHDVEETVTSLNNWISLRPLNLATIGNQLYFRSVPVGGAPENYAPQATLTLAGNMMKPFAPTNVTGARDGSNNLTISWDRNTRAIYDLASPPTTLPQLADELNNYTIEIMDGVSVLRTIVVEGDVSATYDAADQTIDGITPGDPVTVRVYQMSSTIGRGFAREETV